MIKSVIVTNHLGESIKLELTRPDKSGFVIQEITGLGPPKADINVAEFSTTDGSLYTSARTTSRNIVINLAFDFKKTVEDARLLSYKYFPIKKPVKLLIETDNRLCETYGYVESNEPDIFNKQSTTQISILCPDSYFYSAGPGGTNVTIFHGLEDLFVFPFSNESVTEDLIEFGDIKMTTEQTVYYTGDAEVGIIIRLKALGEVSNISIYNVTTKDIMRIDDVRLTEIVGSGIVNGDEIIISTVKGDKYVGLLRDGIYTNILNALDRTSNWFQLSSGDNVFTYTADTGGSFLYFRIENRVVYEGV